MSYGYIGKENERQRAQRELAERIYCGYLRSLRDAEGGCYRRKEIRQQAASEAMRAAFAFFEMHRIWVDDAAERFEEERK